MDHKKIITNWKEFEIPHFLHRKYDLDTSVDFINTLTGPRRAGKTYFCFQIIKNLLDGGIQKENILYINFEDNRLIGANSEDLEKLLESFFELFQINRKQKIYLFLDEIQTVKEWDSWVRKIYDTRKDIRLIITGSSSKMLSREISTKLRGRVINKEIFPLSFKEILLWKNIKYDLKTISYSKEKSALKKEFSSFVMDGGYPAIAVEKLNKDLVLQGYYDSMILKDIVERYKIENVKQLKELANLLFASISKEVSYSKIANKLNSIGFKISKSTVIEHISYFEESYLFFQNLKYDYSLAKQLGSIKKIYCIDNGVLNSVSFKFSEDIGKLIENLAYIELKRRGEQVYYHRRNYECDFIIVRKNKVFLAIQVTKKLDEENEKREINGLLEAIDEHKLDEGLILTEDQEDERIIDKKKIKIIPIWKWLLTEGHNVSD